MLFSFTKCSAIAASLLLLSGTVLSAPINDNDNDNDNDDSWQQSTQVLQRRSPKGGPIPQREDDACIRVEDPDLQDQRPHLNNWSLAYQTIDGNKAWRSNDLEKGWTLSSPSNTKSCDKGVTIVNSGHDAGQKNMVRVNPKDSTTDVWYWMDRHDYCRIMDLSLDDVGGVEIHTM